MNTPTPRFVFEPLGDHDRAAFSCGVEPLDRYFKEQASQDARKHVAAPFVLVMAETRQVAGYYTLSATSIRGDDLPPELLKKLKLPRYPHLPATLLGRLARDERFRGQRIGEMLLVNALKRAWDARHQIASTGVAVDAIDERAAAFYTSFGFMPFPEARSRLFLPMRTIGALFPPNTARRREP